MENPEGVLNLLDEFAKLKSKEIPNDLEEYLLYVAASGDPVYQWSLIKSLYRQKLINVITEFYEMCPVLDIPRCPNVDPFNYETMKTSLLNRLDSFSSAPFTIQRISELLTTPRKQYNRVDKFMRAIEKNIWVVSTREPGTREQTNTQETSTNLVNGVTPRVCVTVKHPKRVKSIEERVKSGHPQLIDDDEEEEEDEEDEEEEIDEYEQMEEETSTEILPNNDSDDTSLQCTSVKNLIEKYENGTIFSNTEEKSTDFEEKPVQLEEASNEETATASSTTEPEVEEKLVPIISGAPEPEVTKKTSDSVEEPVTTSVSDLEKETAAPIVAADSSSDSSVQKNNLEAVEEEEEEEEEEDVEEEEEEEEEKLDSALEISEDAKACAQPSTSSNDSDLAMITEDDSETSVIDTQAEPSSSNASSDATEEFQAIAEPSSETESQAKETDTVNETIDNENECD